MLTIDLVQSCRDRRDFLNFPWKIYADDPNWVPDLASDVKGRLNFVKHPFYNKNRIASFIARRDGVPVGRISAILNLDYIRHKKEVAGFFGFFECEDNQETATALFDVAKAWLAEQDIYVAYGPMNPSANHPLGLLTDGFDTPPYLLMTHNPPYYQKLVEEYGLVEAQELVAFLGHREQLPATVERFSFMVEEITKRYNVTTRRMNKKHFKDEIKLLVSMYNRALVHHWGVAPMSDEEAEHMAKSLRAIVVPELIVVLEVDGKVAAMQLNVLDYNPRIRKIKGRLFPFGFLHLLLNKRKIKNLRIMSTNVLPEYHMLGLPLCLLSGLLPLAEEWGVEAAEFSWVMKSNRASYGALKKSGLEISKTYQILKWDEYEKQEGKLLTQEEGEEEKKDATEQQRLQLRQAIELNPQIRVVRPEPPQGELEIVEVTTRKQINQFVKLPWTVYENDPWWSPPLLTTEKDYINPRKNPFYLHGSAAKFLALRDGKPVGRILAADDPEYNNYQNANVGTFGMFECLDDRQAAHRLLDTANEWIRDRGRYTVTGPIDYSLNYSAGLLVDGFHTRASFLMNHGKVYYQDFLESWGLKKAKDLYSWWFDAKNNQLADWAPRIKKIKKHFSINVRPFQINDIENEVRIFRNIINETHKHNWGFVPLSEAETNYYFKMLAKFAMPELVLVAEIAGEPIGVSLCIPDFNELFAPLNGRLTRCGLPTKLWHLFKNRRKFTQARIALLGVLEKYRSRGVVELLSAETMRVGIAAGLIGAEFGWTLENNEHVNRVIEKSGGTHFRTHRIYEKRVKE